MISTEILTNNSLVFYTVIAGFFWLCLIAASLLWYRHAEHNHAMCAAKNTAIAHFNKDQAFRFWAAGHGGVYVEVNESTPPNPNLDHIAERDLVTPSGKKLTLMNPAYIIRQIMQQYDGYYGIKGKITSLKLLNPDNAPDQWERNALLSFEQGETEALEYTDINDKPYLRLMRPMIVKKTCLKCHSDQGYNEGDVRGGVSVALPMAPYIAMEQQLSSGIYFWHALLSISGFMLIFFLI